ncbi:bifunctional phosphoglucose/phosphomannose isomerase [Candidatus Woesearchaeota archaeon]|nr:bifunctional phosphoglucose/phosphomannose isomerase [Candidatus Woesearchaeota archaeon]
MENTGNMLEAIKDFPEQMLRAYELGKDVTVPGKLQNIIVCGMGGSAIPGDFLRSYAGLAIPLVTNREYSLPEYVGPGSLVFLVSYSGNTEETVSCFRDAMHRHARMVVITSGGYLAELAGRHNIPKIIVPSGIQPRAALAYLFFPMLKVLSNSGLIEEPLEEIRTAKRVLAGSSFQEQAKGLARNIAGKIPLIYSSSRLYPAAYRWKTQFNENSKTHAFANAFSEHNHNELVGFTVLKADYHVIFLIDEKDHPQIQKRIRIAKDIISKSGVRSTEILLRGDNFLAKLMSAVHIGDLVSYYLATEYGIDPSPVHLIEQLKQQLK